MRAFIAAFAAALFALFSYAANKPLSNEDVVAMSQAGVPQSTIIMAIRTTPADFDSSPNALATLCDAGVSQTAVNEIANIGKIREASSFGRAGATFPLKEAIGKTVRFSGWIKTDKVLNGYAGLWWMVAGDRMQKPLSFDNSKDGIIAGQRTGEDGIVRAAAGTTDWARYEIECLFPKERGESRSECF